VLDRRQIFHDLAFLPLRRMYRIAVETTGVGAWVSEVGGDGGFETGQVRKYIATKKSRQVRINHLHRHRI
jgi:hypothetical protein